MKGRWDCLFVNPTLLDKGLHVLTIEICSYIELFLLCREKLQNNWLNRDWRMFKMKIYLLYFFVFHTTVNNLNWTHLNMGLKENLNIAEPVFFHSAVYWWAARPLSPTQPQTSDWLRAGSIMCLSLLGVGKGLLACRHLKILSLVFSEYLILID